MIKLLRFADLRARGVIASWPMLRRRVERDGFPPGFKLGENTRAWDEAEVEAWIRSRPATKQPPRGAAKARQARRKAAHAARVEA
jgi:Prophage CP4-57 regulatory protein (AlpA)